MRAASSALPSTCPRRASGTANERQVTAPVPIFPYVSCLGRSRPMPLGFARERRVLVDEIEPPVQVRPVGDGPP